MRILESEEPIPKIAPSGWNAMAVLEVPSGVSAGRAPVRRVVGLLSESAVGRSWMDQDPSAAAEATRVPEG